MKTLSDQQVRERAAEVLAIISRGEGKAGVVGSLNADLTVHTARLPRPGETVPGGDLQILPGGKSANQSVACARLGTQTVMVGAIGSDANGRVLMDSLTDAGVDTAAVLQRDTPTGTAVITYDDEGENTIVVSPGANGTLSGDDVRSSVAALEGCSVLGLCLEVGDDALLAAAEWASEYGARSVVNISPLRQIPDSLVPSAGVVVVNEHELEWLTGSSEITDELASQLADHGVDCAVVTLGAAGSVVVDHGEMMRVPAFATKAVDTTGCGDAFTGGLLAGLANQIPLADAAACASAVAALAATKVGAQASYPRRETVDQFVATIS